MAEQRASDSRQPSVPPPPAESPAHEELCNHCGKCCYKKVIVGRAVIITPFPCEFLDTRTNTCTVYERRYELNPHCLSVPAGMKHRAFPADCPYVEQQAPPDYRPPNDRWSWAGEWQAFDEWADDLEVSAPMREMIRARGPDAPPLWEEAIQRLRENPSARPGQSGSSAGGPWLWGSDATPQVLDLRSSSAPSGAPVLADVLRRRSSDGPGPAP